MPLCAAAAGGRGFKALIRDASCGEADVNKMEVSMWQQLAVETHCRHLNESINVRFSVSVNSRVKLTLASRATFAKKVPDIIGGRSGSLRPEHYPIIFADNYLVSVLQLAARYIASASTWQDVRWKITTNLRDNWVYYRVKVRGHDGSFVTPQQNHQNH